ncbi:uncharacterized protein LOC119132034 isoform X2 [Syngnathus acus]|uniref:uncharacterized protein LOC119132034 isoform X2 n=1 Tax=Syngnathus acus TaxID=161584 RepID=UPI00188635B8|nr:uncharacterized protein LOC119132034 isoform X2 [Syngnathus acus]
MENVGENRKRKMKFEVMELAVLVEEANKHIVTPLEAPESAPQSSQPKSPTDVSAEPQKNSSYEDIDKEMLQLQKNQSAALQHGLQSIVKEVRVVSSVMRASRRDTQAIVGHTRQLVSAVSDLTTAISVLTRVIEEGVRAVGTQRAFCSSGPSTELSGNEKGRGGEEGGESEILPCEPQRNLRKRKTLMDETVSTKRT